MLVTQSWFHQILHQNCFSCCLVSSRIHRAGIKPSSPGSSFHRSTLVICSLVLLGVGSIENCLPGVAMAVLWIESLKFCCAAKCGEGALPYGKLNIRKASRVIARQDVLIFLFLVLSFTVYLVKGALRLCFSFSKGKREIERKTRQILVFISVYFITCHSSRWWALRGFTTLVFVLYHTTAGEGEEGLYMQNSSSLHIVLHKALMNQKYCLYPCSVLASSSRVDALDLVFGVSKIWTSPWWSMVYLGSLTHVLNDSL